MGWGLRPQVQAGGLRLTQTGPQVWGAAWRKKAQAALAIAVGVIALGACGLFLYLYHQDSSALAAYNSATNCASADGALSGTGCRYQGQANVLSTSRHDRLEAVIGFDSLAGRSFETSFPNNDEPDSAALKAGGTAPAELWDGKVTHLAGKMTFDDPERSQASAYLIMAVIFGVSALVIFVLAIPLARTAWRQS
jgi:hypothetical protein